MIRRTCVKRCPIPLWVDWVNPKTTMDLGCLATDRCGRGLFSVLLQCLCTLLHLKESTKWLQKLTQFVTNLFQLRIIKRLLLTKFRFWYPNQTDLWLGQPPPLPQMSPMYPFNELLGVTALERKRWVNWSKVCWMCGDLRLGNFIWWKTFVQHERHSLPGRCFNA